MQKRSPQFRKIWVVLVLLTVWCAPVFQAARAQEEGKTPRPQLFLPVVQKQVPVVYATASWLGTLNIYRKQANLPQLTENPSWSSADVLHARYIVKNDRVEHSEDASNPWYTEAGAEAANSSNLMASSDASLADDGAIEMWMQGPFHALGVLDPKLAQVGYGSYREADGNLQMAAALDVLRGLGPAPAGLQFPIIWPANGKTVSLFSTVSEYPDPLTGCSGYSAPAGLPILLQFGSGAGVPKVSAHSISRNGAALESCVYTEATYKNPDGAAQELGRSILDIRDAVVLIPRQPLARGATYTVSITVNGSAYTWSFNTAK